MAMTLYRDGVRGLGMWKLLQLWGLHVVLQSFLELLAKGKKGYLGRWATQTDTFLSEITDNG